MSKKKVDNAIFRQNPAQEARIDLPVAECCSEPLEKHLSASFFKALGDPNRVALLARLAVCGRPATVGEIACCLPIDLSVVSRHLAQLREAGILDCEKRGKEVFYFVRYQEVVSLLRSMADAIETCCVDNDCCGYEPSTHEPAQARKRAPSTRRKKS